jgi:hypothetical protein
MAGHVAQSFKDFHEFLSGRRAPALIGQSLATVVVQDPRDVARSVASWAYANPSPDRFTALVSARDKVFDIFFYRVVRFRRIYDFFDRFEQALVETIPEADRPYLSKLLDESPWRQIRPLGSFRDPLEYALEKRRRATPQRDRFNDDFYRNATHQILSVEKRHTFEDERTESLVSLYQSQLASVFDDFVDLIKDPQQRQEILLANTADRHAAYAQKSRFDIGNYVPQLMEFVVALINDDFFEHGMQAFGVVRQIHKDFNIDMQGGSQRFKAQSDLINRQKLAEYTASPTRPVLLRPFLPIFEPWTPRQLLETMLLEQERRARKLAVSLLESYGSEIYELVVERLASCTSDTPWYYVRNLAYVLGRIVTGNDQLKHRAVRSLAPYLAPDGLRQVNLQVAAALGFIGSDEAIAVLVGKLEEFGKRFSEPEVAEIAHKIVSTLLGATNDRGIEAACQFCLARNIVTQHREELARASLPESLRTSLVGQIRQSFKKVKLTRSLLGNAAGASMLVAAFGRSGYPEVDELCREIVAALPKHNPLAAEASRILATPPPPPAIASDRLLNAYLLRSDVPLALCYALDAGISGRIEIQTREGTECWIDLAHGQVIAAEVSDSLIENERALYWIALLEPRDIASIRFTPAGQRVLEFGTIKTPTSDLLRDVLFQRAEVRQIVDGIISPESRFKRRNVHPIYTDFSRLDEPEKYLAVWRAVGEEADIKTIRSVTGLSRHDIFRILLYFHRRNMLSVDAATIDPTTARATDAVATIEVYVRRIEQRPLQFRFYHTAAEGCAFLERQPVDEIVRNAAAALGAYLTDAYRSHRAFVAEDIAICRRTLDLVAQYHRSRNAADLQALADYVAFAFASVSTPATSVRFEPQPFLEQLENIAFCNDPFEPTDKELDEDAIAAIVEAIEHALAASGVSQDLLVEGEQPTSTETSIMLEIFRDVATGYTKPIKDFVREIKRSLAMGDPVSSGWLLVIEPSIRLLSRVAAATHVGEVETSLTSIAYAISEHPHSVREVPSLLADLMLEEHRRLAEIAPLAFALDLSDDMLTVKKSELLATFILRQMEGVTDEILARLAIASLTTFEAFLDTFPEDIVVAAEIDPTLAEAIFMKFYQYQDLYRFEGDPGGHPKYAAMFEIGLSTLKELCVELERIAAAENAGREVDQTKKRSLLANRQRALASLLTLLCLRGQYDRIEVIQTAPFEIRILLLDEYYAEFSGSASLSQMPSGSGSSTTQSNITM